MDEIKQYAKGTVNGCLHIVAETKLVGGVVLTHGAGSNCEAPLLLVVARALASAGYLVLRCDLAFRQRKRSGPPPPGSAASDRESLRQAVEALRAMTDGKLILGGHSYGGRQASMLAAEDASIADSLLLLSYPLHPPAKPEQMRTGHFPQLAVPSLFVHGTKDSLGTVPLLQEALTLIPAKKNLSVVEGAGHDLARGRFDLQSLILEKLL